MSKLFIPPYQSARVSAGLLVLRVFSGVALVLHGWSKIQQPMSWIDGLKQSGAEVPGILETLAPMAAVGEFLGGILLAIGLMSPIAALLVLGTMAGAVYFHLQNGQPFVGAQGSYELATMHLGAAMMVFLAGPGAFSLDKALFKSKG